MTSDPTLTLAAARPFQDWDSLRITGLIEISEGWECQVFAFTVDGVVDQVARSDDLILRIYQGQLGDRKCERECMALKELHRAGFPVPAIIYWETAPGIDGRPFAITERVAGAQLAALLQAAGEEERVALIRRFCRLFVDLHGLEWRPSVSNAAELETRDTIAEWLTEARHVTAQFGIAEFEPVLAWLEEHKRDVRLAPPSRTHNDYHPWNVLCPSSHELMVIDWTGADIQDFRFDLAWTLLVASSSLGPGWRRQILAEYETARGSPVEGLAYFDVIAACRRVGDILISLRHGAEAMGMRPGAEAMMVGGNPHLQTAYHLLRERTGLSIAMVDEVG